MFPLFENQNTLEMLHVGQFKSDLPCPDIVTTCVGTIYMFRTNK